MILGRLGIRCNAPLSRDNTFAFSSLESGSYLLTIHVRDYKLGPLRVDITTINAEKQIIDIRQTIKGNEWNNKSPLLGIGEGELRSSIRPTGTKEFYQQRQGFSIVAFPKSPMILMALVSGVMIFGLP